MIKNTETIRRQEAVNCLNVFDHAVRMVLKGLKRAIFTGKLFKMNYFFSLSSQKKQYCFRKSTGRNFFYHLPARISRMCMRIILYIFCFKKTRSQTKKSPLGNLFVRIYVFSPFLVFQPRKVLLEQFFKCKLYLKTSIKLIKNFFCRRPETRVLFFGPQKGIQDSIVEGLTFFAKNT